MKTIELEEVTLSRYISHEGVRTHLQNAEQALAQDNYPDAVSEAAIDFCMAEVYIGGRGVTRNRNSARELANEIAGSIGEAAERSARYTSRDVSDFAIRFQQELSRLQLSDAIAGITKPIEIMYFGIQLSEYDRFKTVTPHNLLGSQH